MTSVRTNRLAAIAAAFASAAVPAASRALPPIRAQFAYAIALEIPAGAPLVRLDVPIEVYRTCVNPALRDLRVLNGAGEVVPFALQRPPAEMRGIPTTLRLPLFALRADTASDSAALQLRIDAGATSIALEGAAPGTAAARITSYLVNADGQENGIDSLSFDWPEEAPDFAVNVALASSDDLVNWRLVVPRAPLARLRQGGALFEQRLVSFPPTRARYWRLRAEPENNLPEITAADATLVMGSVPVERLRAEVDGAAVPGEAGVYDFDLGAQLPVDRVELVLPDINTVAQVVVSSRHGAADPWRFLASSSVYRMQAANGELRSPPMIFAAEPARYWRVKVDPRGGGIGGGTPRLRAGWLADQLVFAARGAGPFELVYGSAEWASAEAAPDVLLPAPDAAFVQLTGSALPLAHAGAPREAGGPALLSAPPPPRPWRAWVLWLALSAGVATLGALAWNLARQMRDGS